MPHDDLGYSGLAESSENILCSSLLEVALMDGAAKHGKHVRRSQGNFYLLCRHDVPNGGVENITSAAHFEDPLCHGEGTPLISTFSLLLMPLAVSLSGRFAG